MLITSKHCQNLDCLPIKRQYLPAMKSADSLMSSTGSAESGLVGVNIFRTACASLYTPQPRHVQNLCRCIARQQLGTQIILGSILPSKSQSSIYSSSTFIRLGPPTLFSSTQITTCQLILLRSFISNVDG
ncbi:hypothetical protein GE21DRAFT_1238046 [Neurospora crassa]|nr:hypothetical protein GE21DRAFT_1238046 [Neurospora crassa]